MQILNKVIENVLVVSIPEKLDISTANMFLSKMEREREEKSQLDGIIMNMGGIPMNATSVNLISMLCDFCKILDKPFVVTGTTQESERMISQYDVRAICSILESQEAAFSFINPGFVGCV